MAYAILRTKKLKSFAAISRSVRHTFREQPTPNADPSLLSKNRTVGAVGCDGVIDGLKAQLPTKHRADAVLCIEYLITASPEAFKRRGGHLSDLGDGYFADALQWLRNLHGAKNVISATIHLDESTPHLVAYVAPLTADGRLSCKDFLGGPAKLRAMQNDFHLTCAKKRGLERGVEGSKAKHDSVSHFYKKLALTNNVPILKSKDYAAAAIGIKTPNWQKAQSVAEANAQAVNLQEGNRKSLLSRQKALKKKAIELEEKEMVIAHKEILLRAKTQDLESNIQTLESRRIQVIKEESKIPTLEAIIETLERRLGKTDVPDVAKARRANYEINNTLG